MDTQTKWQILKDDEDIFCKEYASNNFIESPCSWHDNFVYYLSQFFKGKALNTVIDGGASYGFLTVGFAGIAKKVECFEVDPLVRELLTTNTKNYSNVKIHNTGLWSTSKRLRLNRKNWSGKTSVEDTYDGFGNSVNVVSLDSLTFSKVDLIKLDVEGVESEVIEGAQNTIKNHRPVCVIEIHSKRTEDDFNRRRKIFNFFEVNEYILYDVRLNDFLFIPKEFLN